MQFTRFAVCVLCLTLLAALALACGGARVGPPIDNTDKQPGPTTGPGPSEADVKVTALDVNAAGLLPCMVWTQGENGSAFYALDGDAGILYKFSGPDYKTKEQFPVGGKANWLSISLYGPVVTLAEKGEIRVFDSSTLKFKDPISVPQVKRAVSAYGQSHAAVSTGQRNFELQSIQLFTTLSTRFRAPMMPVATGPGYAEEPMFTPNSTEFYTNAMNGYLMRWVLLENSAILKEKGPRVTGGQPFPISVSPDSRYVAQPSPGGNPDAGTKTPGTIIMDAHSLQKRVCVIEPGAGVDIAPVGIDTANNVVYTGSKDVGLTTYSLANGTKQGDYKTVGKGVPKQNLVHPHGRKVIVLHSEALSYVQVNIPQPMD
jgi:hypothetical protein